jgi:hypothetical protein
MNGPFKGFVAISVIPALISLHHLNVAFGHISPMVFGVAVPCIALSLVLYVLLGAWIVLIIVRNLKRDLPEIQLLSRWECVGLAAFWNLLFYAFLDSRSLTLTFETHPNSVAGYAVEWNALFLFLIGVAALSPHEKLKVWWRKWNAGECSYFAPDGLPWPWLVPAAAIGFAMLAAEALWMRGDIPLEDWRLGVAGLAFVSFLVFTARDILFLQWCLLTRMRHPVMKGILVIVLYDAAVSLFSLLVALIATPSAFHALSLLTPFVLISQLDKPDFAPAFTILGIVLQSGVSFLILLAIQKRLARPVHAPVAGEA